MKEDTVESAKGIPQDLIVVASLVHTLTDSFGAVSDLCRKLKRERRKSSRDSDSDSPKQHRRPLSRKRRESDTESDFHDAQSSKSRRRGERSKSRRRLEREDDDSDEDSINASSELVLAEYQRGYRYLGKKFADGDLIAQNQLQAQIISLQKTLLTVYQAYALHPPDPHRSPISQHLSQLLQSTRAARAASIEALAMQYQRMLEIPETFPLPQLPGGGFPASKHSIAIRETLRPRRESDVSPHSYPHPHPHPHSHSHSNSAPTASNSLFCVYALDLQHFSDQPLSDNYLADGDGQCPFCKFLVSSRPGKAWEIVKEDDKAKDEERVFLLQQRFVVKCHREGGGFACLICSRCREVDTVCGEARALVDHIWREHTCEELSNDEDIVEIG
ncbi:hypothetical protein K504DRAFT_274908 [Pleomassaria siparia CBS 279.74]|uniref:Uncharacterized protein n=1 Tax=Pleomassaria siparia CBS 279.74 TaxID=1314801 RepID=A0A6G1K9A2_9PLEO|nr:hypothetical protein K504DRAFT_274908 [Pleomassaria siparia CBS 279.74]